MPEEKSNLDTAFMLAYPKILEIKLQRELNLVNRGPDAHGKTRWEEIALSAEVGFSDDGQARSGMGVDACDLNGDGWEDLFAARGLAIGDYNNAGRLDVLIGNNGAAPLLLRNNSWQANHWLGLQLRGTKCNRDAIGARITWSAGGVKRSRRKNGGGSYLSSHDPRVVLGLGAATKLDWLEIHWPLPSGKVERFIDLPADRYIKIVEKA